MEILPSNSFPEHLKAYGKSYHFWMSGFSDLSQEDVNNGTAIYSNDMGKLFLISTSPKNFRGCAVFKPLSVNDPYFDSPTANDEIEDAISFEEELEDEIFFDEDYETDDEVDEEIHTDHIPFDHPLVSTRLAVNPSQSKKKRKTIVSPKKTQKKKQLRVKEKTRSSIVRNNRNITHETILDDDELESIGWDKGSYNYFDEESDYGNWSPDDDSLNDEYYSSLEEYNVSCINKAPELMYSFDQIWYDEYL